MPKTSDQLRRDALAIWQAAVDAVRADELVRRVLRVEKDVLVAGDQRIELDAIGRIVVVGGGKAGAGMAAAVAEVLGPRLAAEKQLTGWVNVPDDCVRPLDRIRLHGARPAGVNEPTAAGVAGTAAILDLVGSLAPRDLCLAVISGGGSALLPAPVEGITLADKLDVTRHLSAGGANIEELNTVRRQLSRIKGGGLARACRAGRLVALIISDVLGDPLDMIASGPTVADTSTPKDALDVLDQYAGRAAGVSPVVFNYLLARAGEGFRGRDLGFRVQGSGFRKEEENEEEEKEAERDVEGATKPTGCVRWDESPNNAPLPPHVTNLIIGNNATAVEAAGERALALGYSPAMQSANRSEGQAEDVGRHLAEMALRMRDRTGPDCLISGGEPVVRLAAADVRGRGGRNQQLVLASLERLAADGARGIALLSGGTDGEDGPTDAAGAVLDADILTAARRLGLDPAAHLARNDAYHFFQPLGALIQTGPTGTNVCDVRVVVVNRTTARAFA